MKSYEIIINENLCDGCGDCYISCPINASLKKKSLLTIKTAIIQVQNGMASKGADGCDGCGICIEICHKKAIKLEILV